jgi:3-hydroxyisobutyrate dehydrogenase
MRVAIVGTGLMGAAIARRLTEVGGFELTLWNRTRSRAEELGVGTLCDTPAEAIEGADLVVTSLFDPPALREVFLSADGLVAAADHQVFLETSTGGPEVLIELDSALRASGSQLIASPSADRTGRACSTAPSEPPRMMSKLPVSTAPVLPSNGESMS